MLALLLSSCNQQDAPAAEKPGSGTPQRSIALGDIYAGDPVARIAHIQPLADFIAAGLAERGVRNTTVRVARDIPAMADLMHQGDIDVLIDSPYPVLAVNRLSGGKNILLNQAMDDATYWSVLIARADGQPQQLRDLLGSVVVFEAPHSTSGFLLPAAFIMEAGYTLQGAYGPDSTVGPGRIGCYFSGNETNTVRLVLEGKAQAGAISNQDYRELPQATRDQLKILGRTYSVPRQLVAVRATLDPSLTDALTNLLLSITDEQREQLRAQDLSGLAWTWKFARLTPVMQAQLTDLEYKFERLPDCVAAL
ncbi:MAG: phosphate/phosphite/phosphonate ABC transporter substrate-binding protein [Gammaproteobacteria bacterium]|nr:phosphate/phosphite/phosphonate ABC transporter substrate-binding protein [Gammaproteobacteria bacterium]